MVSLKTLLDRDKLHKLCLQVGFLPIVALINSYMKKENTPQREREILEGNLRWLGTQMGIKVEYERERT